MLILGYEAKSNSKRRHLWVWAKIGPGFDKMAFLRPIHYSQASKFIGFSHALC